MKTEYLFVILLAVAGPAASFLNASDDWRTDLSILLETERDYAAAAHRLRDLLPSIEGEDRITAEALLAYVSWKTGDAAAERLQIVSFFESYGDAVPSIGFLGTFTRRDFLAFWSRWSRTYPLITGISLLVPFEDRDPGLPGELDIGIDISNEALYKLSSEGIVSDGGLWQPGFRILTLPLPKPFSAPFSVDYDLELKTESLTVRKRIRIEAETLSRTRLETAPAAFSESTEYLSVSSSSGELSLYIGDELILIVRKTAPRTASLKFPLPGPSMPGQKPFLPPPRDDPMASGASILDAVGLAYKALSDLTRRKPSPPSRPSYRKADEWTVSYIHREGEASVYRVLAEIRLRAESAALVEDE